MQNSYPSATRVIRSTARGLLAKAGAVALTVILLAFLLEMMARSFADLSRIFQRSVDIQSAEVLHAKIADFQARPGRKVVIMGDSLVYGQTMAQHGDPLWQDATLARQLAHALRERLPGEAVEILDLGMNGALPVDLEELARIVGGLKPDLLIFDVSLRSFSRDFGEIDTQRTRKWLNEMAVDNQGNIRFERDASVDGWFRSWALNNSALYRLRGFGQSLIFGGQPATYFLGLRNDIDRRLRGAKQPTENDDEIILMLRARARYANIDVDPANPQRKALDRLVAKLIAEGQPTLVFYATENAEIRDELIAPDRFKMLEASLKEALRAAEAPLIHYVGPLDTVPPKNYLDHVHLDRQGYGILAKALVGPALDLLARQRPR